MALHRRHRKGCYRVTAGETKIVAALATRVGALLTHDALQRSFHQDTDKQPIDYAQRLSLSGFAVRKERQPNAGSGIKQETRTSQKTGDAVLASRTFISLHRSATGRTPGQEANAPSNDDAERT